MGAGSAPQVAGVGNAALGSENGLGDLLSGLRELVGWFEPGGDVRSMPAAAWVPPGPWGG